ncbi:unnamed protein product [Linum tenue]|uniref:Protein kinase domain-containing protein n=1 Tax=Linum tenue TaxID=586396 RepID=A0AAV0SC12_9ROSI|nr:unnamed protein product [Linum tenue]
MAFGCIPNFLITRRRRGKPNGDRIAAVSDESCCGGEKDGKGRGDYDDCSPARYSWDEIERLTRNFACLIGSGGFSNVYLAGGPAAVKVSCSGDYLSPLFNQELDILLRLHHRRIVKLLGYSDDKVGGALVMEYVPNGTLQERLHGSGRRRPLPWSRRMAIAYQLAEAIDYLHSNVGDIPIVHGDIKASNVLLDADESCKLCDFGSAKMGFSSAVAAVGGGQRRKKMVMMGSLGYSDPHYLRTGLASKKNDIYSFGVIVLELLTGREAFSEEKGKVLAAVIRERGDEFAADLAGLVDPKLGGEFDSGEVEAMFEIARRCVGLAVSERPSAGEIVERMKADVASAIVWEEEGKKRFGREGLV